MVPFKVRCLLLVDDEREDVQTLTAKLAESRLEVAQLITATSLSEAVRVIRRDSPDVILLDLDLSDSKSLDTLGVVREITDAVVIVISDSQDEMLGVRCLRAGADDFLVKSELCESCLRQAIVHSTTRRSLRVARAKAKSNLETLCQMAGV